MSVRKLEKMPIYIYEILDESISCMEVVIEDSKPLQLFVVVF